MAFRIEEDDEPIHHGRNLKRFREMVGVKQESLANQLGPGWSQKRVSLLEGKEIIDDASLVEVCRVLRIKPDIIRQFSEQVARSCVIQCYEQSPDERPVPSVSAASPAPAGAPGDTVINNTLQTFLDQCLALFQEQKRLYDELLHRHSVVLEKLHNGTND
ncbi:helix-turn-helix domain-containing protein [Dawidia soli]|uniref:Helix-turn-helix domain-containing protein n=1 Tax=Dawidia soli TaxID=2782352 RepID=A0AAP2DDQ5_9BACT|nr:helix-turn-helix transcriptional regulator [Dawidia soli]MBT1690164.1 helix-turn-helix domain-containing protein [Dawidia soli]